MDFARLDGEIVRARDPDYNFRSWVVSRKLRCPTCDEPVTFASGQYQAPHFRHKPGRGTLDCENFHPSYHIPSPQPVRPDPWPPEQETDDSLPQPNKKKDTWFLDLRIKVEFKKRNRASFIFEVCGKNFLEPASAEICSIQGSSRAVVFGKETKSLAMLINPFKPFLTLRCDDMTVQVEVSRFCDFFADHRYFVITNNLTLLLDEEFALGDIKAVYDSSSEEVLSDLNTQTLIRLLNKDGYTQSYEEAAIKVTSSDCTGVSSCHRRMFLSSFENIVASNESERVLKLDVRALGKDGEELFEGFFELGKGRHTLNMPIKERAAAYLIKSDQVITRLELQAPEGQHYPSPLICGELDVDRSFIVKTSSETQRITWSGHRWVCKKFISPSNIGISERKFPMTKKEWNLEILGMDFD